MSFAWTKQAIERLVSLSLDGESSHAIAARLRSNERTVRKMQWELKLAPRRDVNRWTPKERATLRKLYPDTRTDAIAQQLGRGLGQVYQQAAKLGLVKSEEYLRSPAACRLRRGGDEHPGRATQFKKGIVPHNKGLRRPGWSPGRMRETQFKKGVRSGVAAKNWRPIGTVLPDADGFMRIKVREAVHGKEATGFGNVRVWPLLNRWIWEKHKGPIPPGFAIAFKGTDKANPKIEDLELISRAELMRRNTIHNRYPKEVVNTIMLLGAVKRKLRERSEKHNDGSARNHLFELMEELKDEEKTIDLARAKACTDVARVLVDSAKVEVDFLRAIDSAENSEFFDMKRVEARRSLADGGAAEPRLRRIAG